MERHFDQELIELKKDLLSMGAMAQDAIKDSVEALKRLDADMARRIISADKNIDAFENRIDEQCLDLLAIRQPMAIDLRFVTMAMKISNELERIADLAVDISQRVLDLAGKPLLKPLIDIPKLTECAKCMITDALASFVEANPSLARKVIMKDSEADALRNAIQKELLEDFLMKDPATASRALPLLLIARHLERACDHATNIAEDIIFMVEAKVVRHHPENLKDE